MIVNFERQDLAGRAGQAISVLEAEMKQDLHPAITRSMLGSHIAVTSLQNYNSIPQRTSTKPAPLIDGPCLNDTGRWTDPRDFFIAGAAAQDSSMPVISRIRVHGSVSVCSAVRRVGSPNSALLLPVPCFCSWPEFSRSTHACQARLIDMLEG